MAQITYAGYLVQNANDWYSQEEAMYLAIDSQWNLDPSTPDGLKLASDSEMWATLDELGLKAYNSKDPNKAEDSELDVLLYLTTGETRNTGTPSSVTLIASGVDGTLIEAGSLVTDIVTGEQWETEADSTISGGSVTINAFSVNDGQIEASIGNITQIDSPTSGWQSVTNSTIATPGTTTETDAEVRSRRNKSVAISGQNQVDTMVAKLLTTDDVVDAQVYENDTDSAAVDPEFNPYGLPANSITCIVDGGTDDDVANTIYNDKNPGCKLNAANTPVEISVTSSVTGNVKIITFSRPEFVDMVIGVSVIDDGTLPANIEDLIAEAIIEYSQGDLTSDTDQFRNEGFRIGDDVSAGQLYTPVNSVVGQYGSSYATGIAVNGGNIAAIDFNEKSRFTTANITVTVT